MLQVPICQIGLIQVSTPPCCNDSLGWTMQKHQNISVCYTGILYGVAITIIVDISINIWPSFLNQKLCEGRLSITEHDPEIRKCLSDNYTHCFSICFSLVTFILEVSQRSHTQHFALPKYFRKFLFIDFALMKVNTYLNLPVMCWALY